MRTKLIFLKIRRFFYSKDFLIFCFFVLISTAFWYINSAEQKKEITLKLNVEYSSFPDNLRLKSQLPDQIEVRVRDFGSNIFRYSLKNHEPLQLDFSLFVQTESLIQIPQNRLDSVIKASLNPTTRIIESPGRIAVSFRKIGKTTLPIQFVGQVSLAEQFSLSDSVSVSPAHISVYGESAILDTLKCVFTRKTVVENVEKCTEIQVELSQIPNVEFEKNSVLVKIPVEPKTEKSLKVPIKILGVPSSVYVQTFPASVEVRFSVPTSKFSSISSEDFSVSLDYSSLKENLSGKEKIEVKSENKLIQIQQFHPHEIEFLISEN